jgi:hypothetical protein
MRMRMELIEVERLWSLLINKVEYWREVKDAMTSSWQNK